MAEHLASVPEESATSFTGDYPPRNTYRDWIRTVPVSGAPIGWGLPNSHGSSYTSSRASNSCPSSSSGVSAAQFLPDNDELRKIAHQMVRDGYIQRMVEDPRSSIALENWFYELDVDWVISIHLDRSTNRPQPPLQLQDMSAPSLQDLVHKWIRAFTVIALAIELFRVSSTKEEPAVAWFDEFGKSSINCMFFSLNLIVDALKSENLRAILDMYICITNASCIFRTAQQSQDFWKVHRRVCWNWNICNTLSSEASRLNEPISNAMEKVKTLTEDASDWAVDIARGGDEIHRNTRLMVECIMSMREAWASAMNFGHGDNVVTPLRDLTNRTTDYLKDLLLRISEMHSNLSLRYMFLLNNSYFISQVIPELRNQTGHDLLDLTPECEKYMDRYLDVSWRPVLSRLELDCKPKSKFCGLLHRSKSNNTSSLVEFESAFHENYEAQKFWKVSDPLLRHALRRTIIKLVILGYRDYLKQHPEVEKHVSGGSNSPDALEEMLGELFEG